MQCTENSGYFPLGKRAAIVRNYPFPPPPLCAVFSSFRNPPNTDMNYRIFNVRTFLCVRIHTGVGHSDESAQHLQEKVRERSKFLLIPAFQGLLGCAGKRELEQLPGQEF